MAVDGWRVPSLDAGSDPKELLINISRSILGPAGTKVTLSLQPTSPPHDEEWSEKARDELGESLDSAEEGPRKSWSVKPVGGGSFADGACGGEYLARGRRKSSVQVCVCVHVRACIYDLCACVRVSVSVSVSE